MRITSIDDIPIRQLRFTHARGLRGPESHLSFLNALANGLPDAIEAIFVASDLQGVDHDGVSLGESIVQHIRQLQLEGDLPIRELLGIVLAGDLHPGADLEDVSDVWQGFSEVGRWVVGVAGNHDRLDLTKSEKSSENNEACFVLDGNVITIDGMQIGGLGGTIGNSPTEQVRSERDYCDALKRILDERCDLLLLHDGPNVGGTDLPGWPSVRRTIEAASTTLIIRGHDHWDPPLATLVNGSQVLNTEGRAVILRRDPMTT